MEEGNGGGQRRGCAVVCGAVAVSSHLHLRANHEHTCVVLAFVLSSIDIVCRFPRTKNRSVVDARAAKRGGDGDRRGAAASSGSSGGAAGSVDHVREGAALKDRPSPPSVSTRAPSSPVSSIRSQSRWTRCAPSLPRTLAPAASLLRRASTLRQA